MMLRYFLLAPLLWLSIAANAQFTVNGSAYPTTCGCYTLTDATNNITGRAFNVHPLDLNNPFSIDVSIWMGCNDPWGADGMIFALQTVPVSTGGGASQQGMGGVTPSIGVYMDSFTNSNHNDPANDHISIHLNGDADHTGPNSVSPAVLTSSMDDCQWHTLTVSWNPAVNSFMAVWDGTQTVTYNNDLVNNLFGGVDSVYWGITAATGGLNNEQRFCVQPGTANANFSATTTCPTETLTVTDNSTAFIDVATHDWNWGDGSPNDSTAGASHTYASPGTYTVTYVMSDHSGCMSSVTQQIDVIAPSATAFSSGSGVCDGDGIQLNVTGNGPFNFAYSWGSDSTLSDTAIANPIATPSDTTTYTVSIVDVNQAACSASSQVTVNWIPRPSVELGNDTAFCDGNSIVLDAGNPGDFYSWQDASTTQTYLVDTSGQYIVTVASADLTTCTDVDTVNIDVVPYPTVDLASQSLFCDGQDVTLDAGNPGEQYAWSDGSTMQTLTVQTGGQYWVTVIPTVLASCSASDTVLLNSVPVPQVDLGNDTTFCGGQSITLDAGNSGVDYLWQSGDTTQLLVADTTGWFVVEVSNELQPACADTDSVHVTVVPFPMVDLGGAAMICSGESLVLDAGNAGATYLWNDNSTNQTISVSAGGDYSVTVTPPQLAICATADTIMVSEVPFPVVNLGPDTVLCEGETLTLDAGNVGAVYVWSDNSGSQTLDVTTDGQYSVVVSSATHSACSDSDMVVVNFEFVPEVELGPDSLICTGDTLELDAGSTGLIHLWHDGSDAPTYTLLTSETASVTVTNPNNERCSATDERTIALAPLPDINLGDIHMMCPGSTFDIDAGDYAWYRWHDGFDGPIFTAVDSGFYWVEVWDSLGCYGSDTLEVRLQCPFEVTVPNVFTPNGDGINDAFMVRGEGIQDATISIFNRWGIEVFSGTGNDTWDGRTSSGIEAVPGTYFVVVAVTPLDHSIPPEELTRTITLLR